MGESFGMYSSVSVKLLQNKSVRVRCSWPQRLMCFSAREHGRWLRAVGAVSYRKQLSSAVVALPRGRIRPLIPR